MAEQGNQNPIRLYQAWKGSNILLLGRLIFGPDVSSLYLTIVLIGGLLYAFVLEFIKTLMTMTNMAKIVITGTLCCLWQHFSLVLDILFLLMTSSRDPGIIPRNTKPPESEEAFDMNTPSME
ncbi:putative protein S-acyltransferase [Helianthus annuus]|nr:putative protein S-acyltransferase [Helianthus annuus]